MDGPCRWSPPTLVSVQERLDHVLLEVRRAGRARLANILKRCRNHEMKLRAGRWVLNRVSTAGAVAAAMLGPGRIIANDSKSSRNYIFEFVSGQGPKIQPNKIKKTQKKHEPTAVAADRFEIVGLLGVGSLS